METLYQSNAPTVLIETNGGDQEIIIGPETGTEINLYAQGVAFKGKVDYTACDKFVTTGTYTRLRFDNGGYQLQRWDPIVKESPGPTTWQVVDIATKNKIATLSSDSYRWVKRTGDLYHILYCFKVTSWPGFLQSDEVSIQEYAYPWTTANDLSRTAASSYYESLSVADRDDISFVYGRATAWAGNQSNVLLDINGEGINNAFLDGSTRDTRLQVQDFLLNKWVSVRFTNIRSN